MPATVKHQQLADEKVATQHPDPGNVVVSRTVNAPPDTVWSVLADGWLYATWVVGASRIPDVDLGWPRVGSCIHHSVGLWQALIDDTTHVLASREGTELVLQARAWPAGEAEVRITLTAERADQTAVSMAEDATGGPGRLIPRPVRQALIGPRNVETLRRLALLAEGRYRDRLAGR